MNKPLTHMIRPDGQPLRLREYEQLGGYNAIKIALRMSPEEVTQQVKDADLQGRGGAGFSTGTKWSFVPMGEDAPDLKYLIVNGDEMEPGTINSISGKRSSFGNSLKLFEFVLYAANQLV